MATLKEKYNILEILTFDHLFLKECIETLTNEDASRSSVVTMGRKFLSVLDKHAKAEEKTLYAGLEHTGDLHVEILESEIEHGIAAEKIKYLKPILAKATVANDRVRAELKVLAEVVEHHIKEEENELFKSIQKQVTPQHLTSLGDQFMKLRKFTPAELKLYPRMSRAVKSWEENHGMEINSKSGMRVVQSHLQH